jgi:addiction module RelB/DinJ family antitoxin
MKTQSIRAQDARINIRVDRELKREAEDIFEKIGLNISDGINVYLRRVVADKGIPFPLTISRARQIGEDAAEIEASFGRAVKSAIIRKQASGLPVARFDADTKRPYLEYPDGRRKYELGAVEIREVTRKSSGIDNAVRYLHGV